MPSTLKLPLARVSAAACRDELAARTAALPGLMLMSPPSRGPTPPGEAFCTMAVPPLRSSVADPQFSSPLPLPSRSVSSVSARGLAVLLMLLLRLMSLWAFSVSEAPAVPAVVTIGALTLMLP